MKLLREPLAALITAICALALDAGTLHALVSVVQLNYLLSATVAFLLGTLVSWALSVRWVFKYRRMSSPTLELGVYTSLGILGLALNIFVIFMAVHFFHMHYLVGKGFAAMLTFSCNYLLRKWALFSPLAAPVHESTP
jgi:putative flippase GtrA